MGGITGDIHGVITGWQVCYEMAVFTKIGTRGVLQVRSSSQPFFYEIINLNIFYILIKILINNFILKYETYV